MNWLQAVLCTFLGRAFPGMCICLFETFFHFPSPSAPKGCLASHSAGLCFLLCKRQGSNSCWRPQGEGAAGAGTSPVRWDGPGTSQTNRDLQSWCLVWFNFQTLKVGFSLHVTGSFWNSKTPSDLAVNGKKQRHHLWMCPNDSWLLRTHLEMEEDEDGRAKGTNPMLEVSLPISLAGHGVEGATWAGITPQLWQTLFILNHHLMRNPFISSLRDSSSQLPFLLGVFSNTEAQVVSNMAGAPGFQPKIQSLIIIMATQAASEESRRNPGAEAVTEKSVPKRLCHRNIHPPRYLEADVCIQTQHFTSVHTLIWFPGLPHLNLMFLPPKRHPSHLRAGEKKA